MGLVQNGLWWTESKSDVKILRRGAEELREEDTGLSMKDAVLIMPQVREIVGRVDPDLRDSYHGEVLVNVKGDQFYVHIDSIGNVELPLNSSGEGPVKTSNSTEIAGFRDYSFS
jgi:hypothetical protein